MAHNSGGYLQPGLTGGSGDSYIRHMLSRARNKGWRVVVFNSRGCAHSPVTTPQVSLLTYERLMISLDKNMGNWFKGKGMASKSGILNNGLEWRE